VCIDRFSLCLVSLTLFAVSACNKSDKTQARPRPPPSVTTAQVATRDVNVEIKAPVDLRPIAQADVGAKTLGYLDAVLVDRGDRVHRGQLLALVRPSDLPDQLEAARSAYDLAKANKDRAEKLAPTGVVSEQELQAANAAYASATSQVAAVSVRLGETRITAPLDGFVAARRLDPGALVGPGTSTGAILTVMQVDVLRIFIPVNERDVATIALGQDAHLEVDALPGKIYSGNVVRISPGFDPLTRTIDAEVHLKNPGELRPGMYGRGSIITSVHKGALVVPSSSVQLSSNQAFVYVLHEDKVKRVPVQLGVDGGDWLEVTSGLAPLDQIVTAGTDVLSDGTQVHPQKDVNPFSGTPIAEGTTAP